MIDKERWLVTGGAGFIGSHLVESLLSQGHYVRVLDDFSTGLRANLPSVGAHYVHEGSVLDPKTCRRAIQDIEYVAHLAAKTSVPESLTKPLLYTDVNLGGTLNLLEASVAAGPALRRMVLISTSAVYGNGRQGPLSEGVTCPLSPYAASKLAAEQYCNVYNNYTGTSQRETAVLRLFNVYGPRQRSDSPYSGVISKFMAAAAKDQPLTIHSDGTQVRDFIHVSDVVRAIEKAARGPAPKVAGGVFNVGTGKGTSINQLAEMVKEATASLSPIELSPSGRQGDVRHSVAYIGHTKHMLDWAPTVELRTGLRLLGFLARRAAKR